MYRDDVLRWTGAMALKTEPVDETCWCAFGPCVQSQYEPNQSQGAVTLCHSPDCWGSITEQKQWLHEQQTSLNISGRKRSSVKLILMLSGSMLFFPVHGDGRSEYWTAKTLYFMPILSTGSRNRQKTITREHPHWKTPFVIFFSPLLFYF